MTIREIVLAGLFAAITCVMSLLAIPLGPVPFTLQVLAVLLAGAIGGTKIGFFSQLTYLLLGLVGLPVYSQMKSGPGHLFGPRGGFIFGFVIAALFIGFSSDLVYNKIKNKYIKYSLQFASMLVGVLIIYSVGLIQLKLVTNMTFLNTLQVGVIPFIGFDLVKVIIAISIVLPTRNALLRSNLLHISKN